MDAKELYIKALKTLECTLPRIEGVSHADAMLVGWKDMVHISINRSVADFIEALIEDEETITITVAMDDEALERYSVNTRNIETASKCLIEAWQTLSDAMEARGEEDEDNARGQV